jgi:magnesium transporter
MGSRRSASCLVRRGAETYELPTEEFDAIDGLRQQPQTVVWLKLDSPAVDDLRLLQEEFAIHPLAMEDVRKRGQRPKLDSYPDQHMLVVHEAVTGAVAPAPPGQAGDLPPAFQLSELHAFGGRGWLVTVQWGASPAVEAATARFARAAPQGATVGGVLHAFFDAAVDSYFPILDAIAERMDALEDRVLAGDGGSAGLSEMLAIKRELLELRRVLAPMREVANSLLRRDTPLIDDVVTPYFQDLYDHLVRLLDQLDLYRDLLASILDARLTVANNSLNAVMKRLTAITVILMAPTLIAGVYGMNFDHMPELDWPLGYPFALGLMVAVMLGALAYFRIRDWF